MQTFYWILIICLGWICTSCTTNEERSAIQIMEQAEKLISSDLNVAHVLLTDSLKHPENLDDKMNARWCMLRSRLADSIHTELPYVPQMERAYKYMKRNGSTEDMLKAGLYLGRTYMDDLKPEAALHVYSDILSESLSVRNQKQTANIYSYMGDVYEFQQLFPNAIEKYLLSSSLFEEIGMKQNQAGSLLNVSRNYAHMDSLDQALVYMLMADSILTSCGDLKNKAAVYNGLGNIYSEKGNYNLAEYYLRKSIECDPYNAASNYLALADLFSRRGDLNKARFYQQQIKTHYLGGKASIELPYYSYKIEKQAGNTDRALACLEEYLSKSESHVLAISQTQINGLEDKYRYSQLLADNAQLKIKERKVSFLLVLSSFVLLLIFILYRLKLKSRQLVLLQKENEMNILRNQLYSQEKELHDISRQYQEQKDLMDEKMEELYEQKALELEESRRQMLQLRQQILEDSDIYKKVKKKSLIVKADKELLTEKDWIAVYEWIEIIYPNISDFLVSANITPTERKYCYLSFFHLESKQEAVLLNVNVETVHKNHTRIRQKLKLTGTEDKLSDYLSARS